MTTKTLSLITATLLLTTHTFAQETLEDITVMTASKTSQNLKDVTSNVDVITSEDIEERGYTTVTQALNSLAGVSFTQNGPLGTSTSVFLRGMDAKRTLVLIDGIRYNDLTSLGGAPFEHLMVDNILQIEVVKGAQSGIWGADASAGVINIITKKSGIGTHGSVHAEKGSFNTEKYGVTLSKTVDDFYVKLAHNVVKSDGFSAQQPEGKELETLEDDGYKNTTTVFALGYAINESNKIDFSHTMIDAKGEYDPFGSPDGIATSTTNDTFSSVNFNHVDSFNELNVYAKRSTFNRTYTAPDFTGAVKTTPYKGKVEEFGLNSKIPYASSDFLLVGADYKKFKQADTIQKDFENKGFYLTNSNSFKGFIGGETILTESVRHDTYSNFENKTTFKIGLKHIHGAIEGLTSSVNYGTAYNVPSLYQLYSPYGLDTLTPETTTSFDVTLAYKDLKISYFDTKIDDMIDFDSTTFKYANIAGTSKISGIEASYQKEVFSEIFLSVNYTRLLKAEDQEGNDLKRRVTDHVKLSVDYYGITDLHLGVNAEYVGSRTDTKFNPDFSKSDVETGKYTLLHFTANYNITEEIEVYGSIENITDEKYQTVYGYATSPRAFYAGIRAKF
ncbi:MAG: TonB-dependent receptor [Sulfurovum sp.]|nr:TonB-dependent receptor [Sulfurovum sp.]